jgi:hypothetical protein
VGEIVVEGTITGSPSVTLPPGTTLRGGQLVFSAKGVRLTRDNTLRDITITTTPYEVAVYNDTSVPDTGTLVFENVSAAHHFHGGLGEQGPGWRRQDPGDNGLRKDRLANSNHSEAGGTARCEVPRASARSRPDLRPRHFAATEEGSHLHDRRLGQLR